MSRWQNLLEASVENLDGQIRDVSQQEPGQYLPFVGTLFLFIAASNMLAIVPGFRPPTGSLSTTTALAICVFVAVPAFAIAERGVVAYLRTYMQPTPFMLPFNVIGELSRTIALAVRLYGNVMSGTVIVAILIGIAPFFFPVLMQVLGLLVGADSSLHLCGPCHGLHRFRNPDSLAARASMRTGMAPKGHCAWMIRLLLRRSRSSPPGLTIAIGSIAPALGEARTAAQALRRSRSSRTRRTRITRTLFVSLAMIESTAIYCFVVTMILTFANPFWKQMIARPDGRAMQIDWVTVAAQIVNFLVLVWLLKRFLYGPIMRAMARARGPDRRAREQAERARSGSRRRKPSTIARCGMSSRSTEHSAGEGAAGRAGAGALDRAAARPRSRNAGTMAAGRCATRAGPTSARSAPGAQRTF